MIIAMVQVSSPDTEKPAERIERVSETLHRLGDVDLVVLPELWTAGYFHFGEYAERAEDLHGPTVQMAAAAARRLGAHVHAGSIVERTPDGRLQNTSVLIDPDGDIIQAYRKIHVFGYQSDEATLLSPGEGLPVTATDFGRVAGTTCYDLRFPGLWSELSDRGADLVIVPAAWPASRLAHWQLLSSARAVEHQIFVVAVNATGVQDGVALGGHSRVVDPAGEVLGESGVDESVVLVEIDPARVAKVRQEFPVLEDRLPSYRRLAR